MRAKKPPCGGLNIGLTSGLALTCFEPSLRLVDHIDTALAAHNAAIAVPCFERAERVTDFHRSLLICAALWRLGLQRTTETSVVANGGRYWD